MLFWLYDLPTWLFCLITIGACVAFSLAGFCIVNPSVRRGIGDADIHNELVSYFLSAAGVFYGITLGLIAVGAWQTHSETDTRVSQEAASLGAIYRDVSTFGEPERSELQAILREYADFVINRAWPEQRRGRIPAGANQILDRFQIRLTSFEPPTRRQEITLAETFREYNTLIEHRRLRLQSVTNGLPGTLWIVLLAGAAVTIAITWFFTYERRSTIIWMVSLLGALVGLLIFLTAAMDNPFRGSFSIGPDAFVIIRDHLMKP